MNILENLKSIVKTPDDDSLYSDELRPKEYKIIMNTNYSIQVFKPINFEDSTSVAKSIINGNIAIINLYSTNREIARRIVDFLSGATFNREIQIKRISNTSFIFAQKNINVDDSFINALKGNGIEF